VRMLGDVRHSCSGILVHNHHTLRVELAVI
jgi:hypothetical protein